MPQDTHSLGRLGGQTQIKLTHTSHAGASGVRNRSHILGRHAPACLRAGLSRAEPGSLLCKAAAPSPPQALGRVSWATPGGPEGCGSLSLNCRRPFRVQSQAAQGGRVHRQHPKAHLAKPRHAHLSAVGPPALGNTPHFSDFAYSKTAPRNPHCGRKSV